MGCEPQIRSTHMADGFHYCTDPAFATHQNACPQASDQAGERRAAAGLASALLPKLTSVASTLPKPPS